MRSGVLRSRARNLLFTSSILTACVVLSACSSGFQRFDNSIYREGVPQQAASQSNPYPGSIDYTTTASTGSKLAPVADVGLRPDPMGVYHRPEPTYAAPANAGYQQPYTAQPQRQALNNYGSQANYTQRATSASNWGSQGSVSRSSLPEVENRVSSAPSTAAPTYTPPKPDAASDTVYIPPSNQTDNVTTSSVRSTAQPREQGWTATGGTAITIRRGETLYNLSKRYGVPVDAIRKANGLSASDTIQTGQSILIPTYVYGPSASVSAPDNDPNTRAASAGYGYVGEASTGSVAIPTKKPDYYAAVSPTGAAQEQIAPRYQPRTITGPEQTQPIKDYGVVTSGLENGYYTVQSGDSLGRIANRFGTSVAALQQANGITGSAIRSGQKIMIPVQGTISTAREVADAGVDTMTTGTVSSGAVKSANKIVSATKDVVAPEATGISRFRWPVKGRVIEKFDGTNDGIDISVPEGTAVKAAENGVVIYAGSEISEYGNLILIRHSDDWVSAYAHTRNFEVKKGDKVSRGQIIARSGKSGDADRPKLHFELRRHSIPVNPEKHLAGA